MRALWIAAGIALTGIGFVGYVVPVMPGTVFLIGALYCFSRSSPRMERWLLDHPWFGPMLRDWQTHRGIRQKTKFRIVAIIVLACGASVTYLVVNRKKPWVPYAVAGLGAIGVGVVLTRPTPPESP